MLELRDVSVRYGAVQAVRGISMSVGAGQIGCLIGANGAGKSSTLNAISGVVRPSGGEVIFDGRRISGQRASAIVRSGLLQVPEGRQVFPELSVQENLEMGAYTQPAKSLSGTMAMVYEFFPRLSERRTQPAGLMSGGEQQMLAIGRALMAKPRLLLLDEPSMGLAPMVIVEIFAFLRRLRQEMGLTILLVEQNATAALGLSDRAFVLANGRIVAEGTPQEIGRTQATREAFLGRAQAPHKAAA